ncbi:Nucleic-acid-binding protein from mobile element jockey [Anthophora plagiata]
MSIHLPVETNNNNVNLLPPAWQADYSIVRKHKTKRSPEPDLRNVRMKKTTSSLIPLTYRFSPLEAMKVNDACHLSTLEPPQEIENPPPPIKQSLPPPIFLDEILDIQTMSRTLETAISRADYTIKANNDKIKILPKNPGAYRKAVKILTNLNARFNTFQLKQERAYRIVIRHIHHSADLNQLKEELSALGPEVTNINNIRHVKTHQPLSLFYVDLKQKHNNKDVFQITQLMNCIVEIEPPHKKREIVQCRRCQHVLPY